MFRFSLLACALLSSSALVAARSAAAQTLPTGARVVAGQVGFSQAGPTLTITQSSGTAIVNYNSFSVGGGGAITINQPSAQSALLNRVTGDTPSTIAGRISANGQVYLVNPNGIAITRSGVVDVGGGFVASTLGISNDDFKAGRRKFTGAGASAAVSNAGAITVGRGGYAALIGGTVDNAGSIVAPLGKVALGSGESATLDLSGDGFLQVAIPTAAGGKDALIKQSGLIKANGGTVMISAATAVDAARNAVNLSGTVEARSVGGRSGAIVIGGGDGGDVAVTGRVLASGGHRNAGGSVTISGRAVKIAGTVSASGATGGAIALSGGASLTIAGAVNAVGRHGAGGAITATAPALTLRGATVDASGATGGGAIALGGDRQGGGALAHAETTTIDSATLIKANATVEGDGGSVTVWSDRKTDFAGAILARGGPEGGDGGAVEVSSHRVLAYSGLTTLTAPQGATGELLLDPGSVTISDGPDRGSRGRGNSVISVATLQAALAGANVTVGAGAGDIVVAAPVSWGANGLTLDAYRSITVNADLNATGTGGLALITNDGGAGGALTFGAGASASFTGTEGAQTLSINGTPYTLVYSMAELDAIDGLSAIDGGALAQFGPGLSGAYALAGDLSSSAVYTSALVAPANDPLISLGGVTPFTGVFEGLGHTIDGLTMQAPNAAVGLFGYVGQGGVLRDIRLTNVNIDAFDGGGALVEANGGSVLHAYASGEINVGDFGGGLVGVNSGSISASATNVLMTGSFDIGGLVGFNEGTVSSSHAVGAVNGYGEAFGGLVGANNGLIVKSYATGAVTGLIIPEDSSDAAGESGGLAGFNGGDIQNSYATGAVASYILVGGLVGESPGTIESSYATGAVTGLTVTPTNGLYQGFTVYANQVGGLVGQGKDIADSYATGNVTAAGKQIGGLVGQDNGTLIVGSYATGSVNGGGGVYVGALVGQALGVRIVSSYATGAVNGAADVGGLIGESEGVSVANSYATGSVTGHTYVGGLVGVMTIAVEFPEMDAPATAVTSSYATGAVVASGNYVGGLVGASLIEGDAISVSFATGSVSGAGAVGGLVGSSVATIANAYATGAVHGTGNFVGGLIGRNIGAIDAVYSIGAVSGGGDVGGLVGENSGTIANAVFNVDTSAQAAIGLDFNHQGANVAALTTAQLQNDGLPAGFDPTIWTGGTGGAYPTLSVFGAPPPPSGPDGGSESAPTAPTPPSASTAPVSPGWLASSITPSLLGADWTATLLLTAQPASGDPGEQAVNALSDPRFDGSIVCLRGICMRVPPPADANP